MQKFLSKIDLTLVFRLSLSIVMGFVGYTQSDYISGVFAIFLAAYALIAAKYKVGCGYNACGFIPKSINKNDNEPPLNKLNKN